MAFTDRQKNDHTYELQRFLHDLSYRNEKIPPIIPDGIYGSETAQAVKAYQNANNMEPTGEVDSETWSAIANDRKTISSPILLKVIPQNFVLTPKSPKEIIYIIQIILDRLGDDFANIPTVTINGVYDSQMQSAIIAFEEISGAKLTNCNVNVWNMLASIFNARKIL